MMNNTTKRNDVIKMHFIQFANVDELIELIETRFYYARIDIDDELMNHIYNVDENNHNALRVEFNVLHAFIETNLRQCVARHYMRELMKNHENEFINMHAFANENTFHHFDIVVIDENERVSQFAHIYVNDDATIRVES
jgi:hypothetical protein